MEQTKEEKNIELVLRKELENFPLYVFEDRLTIIKIGGIVHISYPEGTYENIISRKTRLDLQIEQNKCYIIIFHIEENKQRQGYGQKMHSCIEEFCKKMNCEILETNPSGESTINFFRKQGYKLSEEKTLAPLYFKKLK